MEDSVVRKFRLMGIEVKTFDEWKKEGAWINRGEKSIERNEKGIPLFSAAQVSFPDDENDGWDIYNPRD